MDIFQEFATDEKLEIEGVWKKLGDAKFLVGRARNDNYMELYVKLENEHKEVLLAGGEAALAKRDEIVYEVTAKTVLLGWEGVTKGPKKTEWPYSVENAIAALKVKDFFRVISAWSNDITNYQKAVEEAQAGN